MTATDKPAPRHMRKSATPRQKPEARLMANIMIAVGSRPDVLTLRVQPGLFRSLYGKRVVRSAPKGTPDLMLFQRREITRHFHYENPTAFHLLEKNKAFSFCQTVFVECKTNRGVLSQEQIDFRAWAVKMGAVYVVARSVDDVLQELDGWDRVERH